MPFTRPTLVELIERAGADVATRLPGADTQTRRSNLAVLSRVHAGAVHGLYGHLDFLAKQLMPDTAEAAYLERWAGVWGVRRKVAATATGQVTLHGTAGHTVPAGALLQRSDGARFVVQAAMTLEGASALVGVAAETAGAGGNSQANTALTLVSPLDGIRSPGLVAEGGLTGGADAETDAALLARLLARIQATPQGGAAPDYHRWLMEVPGVTRAYVFPNRMGPGTVGCTFLMDNADYGPIPSADDVQRAADYLEETDDAGYAIRRPVTAQVFVFALEPAPLDLVIHLAPDTAAVRAAVEAELKDLIRREAEPEAGLYLSHVQEAISLAAGEVDHSLISPTNNPQAGAGQIITLGEITWS